MKKATFVFCLSSFVLIPAFAVEIPKEVASCTNFEKAPRAVKEAFKKASEAAVAAGDMKTLGALFDLLAKEPVGVETFNLWSKAAEQVNAAALVARDRRKAAASQELIAGFREGGSTFGLNTGALEKESANDPGAPFVEAARAVLLKRMPQKDLALRFQLQRDIALLSMQQKAGRRPGRLAAAEAVEKAAFAAVPTDRDGTNAVVRALDAALGFRLTTKDWPAYVALWDRIAKDRAAIYPNVKAMRLAALANAASQANDEKRFDAHADELDKLPLDGGLLAAVNFAAGQVSRKEGSEDMVARLWRRLVDGRKTFSAQERMRILVAMAGMADRSRVRRLPKGSIEPLRKVWDEARALEAETAAADKRYHRGVSASQVRAIWLRNLQVFYLWKEAYELTKNDAFAPKVHVNQRVECVRLAALGGDEAAFQAAYAAVITNAQLTAAQKFNLQALAARKGTADQRDFAKRIAALRGDADVKTWFNLLRGACRYLYEYDSTVEGSKYVMTLVALSAEQLWPEERVVYTATFVEDAPTTANAAYVADIFKKLKTDNRMGKFNCWDSMDKSKDLARLKSGEKPDLAATAEGKEAAVCVCYDTKGVHFFLKLNDPEALKTRDGLVDRLYMECSVQTGDEASWNWELFSALKPENQVDVEWDSPQPGRKMTRDYLKSDVFVAKDCYVVHIFAPWLLAYDRIPSGTDALWRFVAVAGWAGQFGSIGGSSVHELGRGMQVRFDMPAKAERAVRLGVLRAAAGEYRRFRKAWENADFWGDPSIGNPAFYETVVKPYLAELDAAANETEGELDDAALARLSAKLADFSDTRLALDAKRAAYLRAKRFAEP